MLLLYWSTPLSLPRQPLSIVDLSSLCNDRTRTHVSSLRVIVRCRPGWWFASSATPPVRLSCGLCPGRINGNRCTLPVALDQAMLRSRRTLLRRSRRASCRSGLEVTEIYRRPVRSDLQRSPHRFSLVSRARRCAMTSCHRNLRVSAALCARCAARTPVLLLQRVDRLRYWPWRRVISFNLANSRPCRRCCHSLCACFLPHDAAKCAHGCAGPSPVRIRTSWGGL